MGNILLKICFNLFFPVVEVALVVLLDRDSMNRLHQCIIHRNRGERGVCMLVC